MTELAILILAAGMSSRMGPDQDKLLETLQQVPLLRVMQERAQATGAEVLLCLPGPDHPRINVVNGDSQIIYVTDAEEGMSASIRAGVRALRSTVTDVMILPADMPELTTEDLQQVRAAHHAPFITRGASISGQPGHPVIFPKRCFAALAGLQGDEGARSVLKSHPDGVHLVALPQQHATTDLDTPEAWANWRKHSGIFS